MSFSANRIQRRLAAILAADVAGYSRLMGADEEGTLRRLAAARVCMDTLIGEHGGRIANTAGDSVLAEFPSVVDAVICAVAVQRAIAAANADIAGPERVSFRIGIHVGDVMVRDGDLFGDGVNIAARLETLAASGGIALSSKVHEEIAGKLPSALLPTLQRAGPYHLKNIAAPQMVWHIRLDPAAPLPVMDQPSRRAWRLPAAGLAVVVLAGLVAFLPGSISAPQPPSFTVQPFAAQGDSASARQLAAALTSRLAGGVGTIPNIRLIEPRPIGSGSAAPPTSEFAIGGTVIPGRQAVRVEANMVETATGQVIRAFGIDVAEKDMAEMEDEVLGLIGNEVSVEINRRAFPPPIGSPDNERARLLVQEARTRTDLRTDGARALGLYEEALRLSPDDKDIAGWYANALIVVATDMKDGSAEQTRYLQIAGVILGKDEFTTATHRLYAYAKCQLINRSHNPQAALAACNRVRLLLPWSARVYKEIGVAYMQIGLLDQALSAFRQAERLNHTTVARWTWASRAGIVCLLLERNAEAQSWLAEAADLRKDDLGSRMLLAVADHRLGDLAGERREMSSLAAFASRDKLIGLLDARIAQLSFQEPVLQAKWDKLHQEFAGMLAQ